MSPENSFWSICANRYRLPYVFTASEGYPEAPVTGRPISGVDEAESVEGVHVAHAATAGRLAKADLATDMVREFTELQGKMGGIYAREDGLPEEVWKAIYYHYLPIGVEADAAPTGSQLGSAAVTWAAVALADKLDSVVGMFTAGERPTGSRACAATRARRATRPASRPGSSAPRTIAQLSTP